MGRVREEERVRTNDYPTSDGKPMAETDHHRELMFDLIHTLQDRYASEPRVYVSGNLLLFYEEGNRRRHVSPDVFVVKGVEKGDRLNYLLWQEGRAPQVVFEITSSSTRREDQRTKLELYRDVLKVREYFLFDPYGDYLDPPLQGYRLRAGQYRPIRAVQGRLPSRELGLHLQRVGNQLRLFDPQTGELLPTPALRTESAERRAEEAELLVEVAQERVEAAEERAEAEARRAEATEVENARLRRLLAERQGQGEHES
jgi:Uma2 family endonuclease